MQSLFYDYPIPFFLYQLSMTVGMSHHAIYIEKLSYISLLHSFWYTVNGGADDGEGEYSQCQ